MAIVNNLKEPSSYIKMTQSLLKMKSVMFFTTALQCTTVVPEDLLYYVL